MTESTHSAPDPQEARAFAKAFSNFLEWVNDHEDDGDAAKNEVSTLVRDFLGPEGLSHSVVGRALSPMEHVNLQAALNAWTDEPGRSVDVHGISKPPHYDDIHLEQLLTGEHLPPLRLTAPSYVDLPDGPGSTLACLRLALLLVTDERGRYAVLVSGPGEHDRGLDVQIAGVTVHVAQEIHAELDDLRARLNVYRGHVLDVVAGHMGVQLRFAAVPSTTREDVVLPDAVLRRVERHALSMAEHRDALRAAGQHVKRGLLLFGPPGTGKTHTTRYLVSQMAGYTRLLVTGHALHAVGHVAGIARQLEPAAIVLEDVDLVAEDRSFGPGSSPVLFDLLDAMDGAASDADLLFLLTTNRADLLEPALAARPGRVDVAVRIDLPDADARRTLLALYSRDVATKITAQAMDEAVERTDGVTASFIKELLRRAVLESLLEQTPLRAVTNDHLSRALDDLLDSSQEVTRSLLGVGNDPADLVNGLGSGPGDQDGGFQGAVMMSRRYRGRFGPFTSFGPPPDFYDDEDE